MGKIRNVDLEELIEAGLLSKDAAHHIENFYAKKSDQGSNKLLIAFGIIGSILICLGIILILAYNWADFNTTIQTCFAFGPMIIGQMLCGYAIWKKPAWTVWREAAGSFLFLSLGACIHLTNIIFNLNAPIEELTFTWLVLAIPLIYIVESRVVAYFTIATILYFLGMTGAEDLIYKYGLLIAVLPFYYFQVTNAPKSNATIISHWMMAILGVCFLFSIYWDERVSWLYFHLALLTLFGLYLIISNGRFFATPRKWNPYFIFGLLGISIILLSGSFISFWPNTTKELSYGIGIIFTFVLLLVIALGLQFWQYKHQIPNPWVNYIYLMALPLFLMGNQFTALNCVLYNVLFLAMGIYYLRNGIKEHALLKTNFGLLMVVLLINIRVYDLDINTAFKGAVFVLIGIGFLVVNYIIFKKNRFLDYE